LPHSGPDAARQLQPHGLLYTHCKQLNQDLIQVCLEEERQVQELLPVNPFSSKIQKPGIATRLLYFEIFYPFQISCPDIEIL
jgi:hypothetical protein